MARKHDSVETVLHFEPGFFARLELLAKARNCRIEDLVMESLDARFGNLSVEERTRAVEELGRLDLPVGAGRVDDAEDYDAALNSLEQRLAAGLDLGTGGRPSWKRDDLHAR